MRTFHTGGIFTGEMIKQINADFSGKIIIPKDLKTISYRTNHGVIVLKLPQEINLELIKVYLFINVSKSIIFSSYTH